MKEQFVTYEIALALKELGFDEPCFATYYGGNNELHGFPLADMGGELIVDTLEDPATTFKYAWQNNKVHKYVICAPLWQQVIDWCDSKGLLVGTIIVGDSYKSTINKINYETGLFASRNESIKRAVEFAISYLQNNK